MNLDTFYQIDIELFETLQLFIIQLAWSESQQRGSGSVSDWI